MPTAKKYPCPCCGYVVFEEPPGSYDICPICFWEDDISQLRFPAMGGGANRPSLAEAQAEFTRRGVIEERLRSYVRPAGPGDQRDPEWRPLGPTDDPESPEPGRDYGDSYPADPTHLYYWRRTYWRRA